MNIKSKEELKKQLYECAYITTINVDDIINEVIEDLEERIEEDEFTETTYDELFNYGKDWINNRYEDIYDSLNDYFYSKR